MVLLAVMGNEVELREEARRAFDERAWHRAFRAMSAAEETSAILDGADLELLGTAAWLAGEPAADPLARACEAFEAAGAVHCAVRLASDLANYHGMMAQMAQAKRTDLWALGAVLFELLGGAPPFTAESVPALLYAVTRGELPTLRASEPDLPAVVDEVLGRTLVRDPDARFPSAEALAQVLERAT